MYTKILRYLLLLTIFCQGCSLALVTLTDPRPEKFEAYTKAWLGKDELIIAYKTDNKASWIQYSLKTLEHKIFPGKPTPKSITNKKSIPVIINSDKLSETTSNKASYVPNAILVKDVKKHRKYLEEEGIEIGYKLPQENFVLVNFVGYLEEDIHMSIPSPIMGKYRPFWCYPVLILGYPITLSIDTATAPIWITVILVGDRSGWFSGE